MYINPITYSTSVNSFKKVSNEFGQIDSQTSRIKDKIDMGVSIFDIATARKPNEITDFICQTTIDAQNKIKNSDVIESIPVVGRVSSVPEKIKDNDYIPASALISMAVLNGPEDIREVFSAIEQIKALCKKVKGEKVTYQKPYDYRKAQHPFSFFRGTILNDFLNPFSPKCKFPKLASWILRADKSLWDTKIGKYVEDYFKIMVNEIPTNINEITSTPKAPAKVNAYQFIGKNKLGTLTARAMARTPVIGVGVNAGMELAHLIKEVKEGDNFFAEIGKSATRLATSTAINGYLGAVGSKFGPVGSLVGMGFGAVLNAKIERITD